MGTSLLLKIRQSSCFLIPSFCGRKGLYDKSPYHGREPLAEISVAMFPTSCNVNKAEDPAWTVIAVWMAALHSMSDLWSDMISTFTEKAVLVQCRQQPEQQKQQV